MIKACLAKNTNLSLLQISFNFLKPLNTRFTHFCRFISNWMNIEYSQFIGHWSLILWSQTFPSYRNIHMQYSHFIFHVWNFIFLVNFLNTNLHWNDFSFIWKGTHFWSVTLLIRDIKNSLSKSNGSIAFVRRVLTGIFTF